MKIANYNYPLIVFKNQDKNIYVTKNDFGIISKGGDKFYKNLTMIDSEGNVFILKGAKIKGLAPIGKRLRYFQKMWEMELDFDQAGKISLEELKNKIIDHVSQNPKHWLTLDTLEGINERVYAANSFSQLAMMFR